MYGMTDVFTLQSSFLFYIFFVTVDVTHSCFQIWLPDVMTVHAEDYHAFERWI